MGNYASVSLDVVIEIKPVKSTYSHFVRGCADCGKEYTHLVKFCPECGEKISEFSIDKEYLLDDWTDIYEKYLSNQNDWSYIDIDMKYDEDSFYTPNGINNILVFNQESSHSLEVEENTYNKIPIEYDKYIEEFKIEHEKILIFLYNKGFDPNVTFGCIFDYS